MTEPTPFVDGYRLIDGTELNNVVANPVWSTSTQVTATSGGTVNNSIRVVTALTNVTSAAAGAGIVLPQALQGTILLVSNNAANNIVIYADGGSEIDGVPGNIGINLPAGKSILFFASDTNMWQSIEFITGAGFFLENFTGNGVQTDFILTNLPYLQIFLNVYINGVYQQKNTYSFAGNTLMFSEAPPNYTTIEVVYQVAP